jgi:hypothetical protein
MFMDMLDLNTLLVKERVGLMKLADVFDILDPSSKEQVGVSREALHLCLSCFGW